jgi:hypothetical protein
MDRFFFARHLFSGQPNRACCVPLGPTIAEFASPDIAAGPVAVVDVLASGSASKPLPSGSAVAVPSHGCQVHDTKLSRSRRSSGVRACMPRAARIALTRSTHTGAADCFRAWREA